MKPFRMMITGLLLLLPALAFTQSTNDAESKLIGKWLLVKHVLPDRGETSIRLSVNAVCTFEFKANEKYVVSYTNKNGAIIENQGKWKIFSDGKTLMLTDYALPYKPGQTDGDRMLPIIGLTATEFITEENLLGIYFLGKSYYQKQ